MRILYRCWDNPYGTDPTVVVDLTQDRLGRPGEGVRRFYQEWFGRDVTTFRTRWHRMLEVRRVHRPPALGHAPPVRCRQVDVLLYGASGNVDHGQRVAVRPPR